MLLATSTQATYGQGTHSCGVPEEELTKIRSNIIRAMFSVDFYSLNPNLSFAILLPAQLDPLFCHIYQGLRTLARCLKDDSFRTNFQTILQKKPSKNFEGPVHRVRKLLRTPLAPLVQELIDAPCENLELWAHNLRDNWRHQLLQKAAINRPQHFKDVERLCFRRTLLFYKQRDNQALRFEEEDTFMKQGVLRRLLVGRLLTEERDARHRKDDKVLCPCGEEPTVIHISWTCPIYSDLRTPISHIDYENLPMCTQYAALILEDSPMNDKQVIELQSTLVSIWQRYIYDYKSGKRSEKTITEAASSQDPLTQNGHLLKPRPNNQPGVFCCKCGKFVARSKHIRLKITGQPCTQKDSTVILENEGFARSQTRLDDVFQKVLTDYNAESKHDLQWNRKLGKVPGSTDEGLLNCIVCQKQWKWKDRANIRRTRCAPTESNNPSASSSSSHLIALTRRLRRKTTLSLSHEEARAMPSPGTGEIYTTMQHAQPLPTPGSSIDSVLWRTGVG